MSLFAQYRNKNNGVIYDAMSSPEGYEDAHPEAWEPVYPETTLTRVAPAPAPMTADELPQLPADFTAPPPTAIPPAPRGK